MSEPVWLTIELVVAVHAEQLRAFGGPEGLRDPGMLDSSLGRSRNKWSYGETDLAVLSAPYGFGIARNHPFVDGNKRAALLSIVTFLGLNDIDIDFDDAEAVAVIKALAAGEISEEGLSHWIRDNWPNETAARRQGNVRATATRTRPAGGKRAKSPARKPTLKRPGGR